MLTVSLWQDSTVRKALLSFFDWYFSIVPPVSCLPLSVITPRQLTTSQQNVLRPHVPTLLLFLTSAQTHIFPEIRIDGVRQLDVLMRALPDVVTSGWANKTENSTSSASGDGRRVLAGYLALLNASGSREEAESTSGTTPAARVLSRLPRSQIICIWGGALAGGSSHDSHISSTLTL